MERTRLPKRLQLKNRDLISISLFFYEGMKLNLKRSLIIVLLVLCVFLAMASVNAADSDEKLISADNSTVISANDEDNLEVEDVDNVSTVTDDDGSFTSLKNAITTSGSGDEIILGNDYVLSDQKDSAIVTNIGIDITKNLIIDGDNHIINARSKTNVFNIYSDVTLKNIVFTNGVSQYGGVFYVDSGTLTIINCTFVDNGVQGFYDGVFHSFSSINVINSTFINNKGDSSIGYTTDSTNFEGCVFVNNKGNLIYFDSYEGSVPSLMINNSILINNNGNIVDHNVGVAEVNNSWLGNTADNLTAPEASSGVTISNWYLLDMDVDNQNAIISLNNLFDGTNIIKNDNYALPSIDFNVEGINATVNKDTVALDSSGKASFGFTLTEDTGRLTASYNGVSINKDLTLLDEGTMEALNTKITDAIDNGKSEVKLYNDYVYSNTESVITNSLQGKSNNGIGISSDLTIDGQGFTIDGNNKGVRLFSFFNQSQSITFKNINFKNFADNYGGVIFGICNNIKIINCTFTNNNGTASSVGGGVMYVKPFGLVEIFNSTFINNKGYRGGALHIQGASSSIITNISNCIFLENKNTGDFGSAIACMAYGNFYINDCIFLNNTGAGNVNIVKATNTILNIDYNWWGNTIDNYTEWPLISCSDSQNTFDSFLFLDVLVDNRNSLVKISLDNIYTYDVGTSKYNGDLPKITLNVQATNATLKSNTVTLDENGQAIIYYEMTEKTGNLTISYEGIKLTKEIKLLPSDSFTALKNIIDESEETEILLNQNYNYNNKSDNDLDKIEITKDMTIDGAGYTIDAKGLSNIFYFNDDSYTKNLVLKNIIFTNAIGNNGAAVYFKGNKLEIINCTFTNNAAEQGDAVYIANANGANTITQSKFINNTGSNSVAYINLDSPESELKLNNSIFIGNDATYNVKGTSNVNVDYNWWGNTAENYDENNIAKVDGVTLNNWLFVKIDANAGKVSMASLSLNNVYDGSGNSTYNEYALPTITFALGGSNIQTAKNSATLSNGQDTYRFAMLSTLSSLTASYDDITATKTLEYIIVDDGSFNALSDILWFAEGDVELHKNYTFIEGVDSITTGISIINGITINGNGYTIDGKGKAAIFKISVDNVVLNNINFINGISGKGGAIYFSGEVLTIDNCTFLNNSASNSGGAIYAYVDQDMGSITNSKFINNSAPNAGVIYNYGYHGVIDNCIFINNTGNYIIDHQYSYDYVSNSIFLNNTVSSYNVYKLTEYSWFGNTIDNYNTNIASSYASNWLYLNIKFYEDYAIVSLNNLYSRSSAYSSAYSNYNLPEIKLKINSTTLNLETDSITLDSNGQAIVPYTKLSEDAKLTVSNEYVSLTKDFVVGDFDVLQMLVDNNDEIELDRDYTYNNGDSITEGIVIARNITIDGKGHTIDAKEMTRIFNVQALNVTFKNITFANGKSNFEYTTSKSNDGGAIYCNLENAELIEFNVINCTFVNNTASRNLAYPYSGGAIYLKSNECTFNISNSTFINNHAEKFGGAIYINTKNSEFSLYNSSFIGNKANDGGALYIETNNTEITLDKCLFRENVLSSTSREKGNAIKWKTTNDNDKGNVVKNSVFLCNDLNKDSRFSFVLDSGNVNINDNWWGTTAQNPYEFDGDYAIGIIPVSWLYIDGEKNSSQVYVNEPVEVKLILKSYNSQSLGVFDYDDSKLPKVNLTLSSRNGTIDKTSASLNDRIVYTPTEVGHNEYDGPAVVASINNGEFRYNFDNRAHSIITLLADNPLNMYCHQYFSFSDVLKFNAKQSKINIETSNSSVVALRGDPYYHDLNALSSGTAVISFSYNGNDADLYDETEAYLTINVHKIPLRIDITNLESDEIPIYAKQIIYLNITLVVDDIHESYGKAKWNNLAHTKVDDDVNGNVMYSKIGSGTVTRASVNGIYECRGYMKGSSNLTLYYNDDGYEFENVTIRFTVLKIPTVIELDHADTLELKVDDASKINATLINGSDDAKLKYESNNINVVSVDANTGELLATGEGTAIITVKYDGNAMQNMGSTKEVTITVTKYATSTSVTSDKELSLKIGDNSVVTANVTAGDLDLGSPTYISSNTSVATVNETTGNITAVGEGSAIITVKYDGNYKYLNSSDSVLVTVSKLDSSITLNTENPLTINVFNQSKIDAVLNHAGNLSYASSNPYIVGVDENGTITAYAGGIVNITISYAGNDTYAKAEDVNLTVIVNKLQSHINVENTISVYVDAKDIIVANMEGRALRFISNNPNVVTVNETTGEITGITGGTANVTVIFDEDGQYLGSEANVTVTVNKLHSTFTIQNPVISMDVYYSVLINASSNNDGILTFASCDSTIAVVNGNNVTALRGGKVNVTLSVPETERYLANETNVTVTVNKLPSTIVVDDAISVDVNGTNTIVANVNENRQLRYISTNPSIVTVNETTGIITGVIGGTANVTVIFDEDDQYLGSEANVTVTVNKLHSTFTIDNPTVSVNVYGNVLINITSNNDGSMSFISCDETIVTVDGNNVSGLKGGIVNVTVSVAETDRYLANETNVTVTVNKLQSTIVVNDVISVDVYGTNAIAASVNEGRQLHYLSTNPEIVTVDEATGVITGVTGGVANVTVIFDGDDQYLGSEANVTVTVNKLQSTFTIENPVISMDVYGSVLIIANSNSDGILTFASCDSTIAVASGNNVTALRGGKVNVTVSVAETARYLANETNVTVTISKLQSTIVVDDAISVDVDENKSLGASVNENRQLRYVSANDNVVTVNESTGVITGVTGGTAKVTVIFDEDDQYLGSEANVTVTVNKLQSTFTIESPTVSVDVYGNVVIAITSNNDGVLTFTSCDDTIVTVDGNTATGLKGGIANVTVSVAETERCLANETNVTVIVNKIRPTIDVEDTISVDVDETKSIGASVNENRQLYYSSTNSSIVTVNADGEITGIIGGTAKVTVSFHEDDQYLAGEVNVTVIVNRLPSIFTNGPMSLSVDENATINSTLNHDGAVHYEFDPTKLNVTGDGLVTALAGGVHTITVIFDGNERYLENASTVTVTVSRLPADYENEAINLTVFDTSDIEHLITGYDHTNSLYSSSNETVFTVDANGMITALAGGSALLNIQFPETDKYLGDSINITVNVRKLPTIFMGDSQMTIKVNENKSIAIGANHNRQLTYETSNANIVTVDENGVIKGIIGGTAIITVSYGEDGQYLANSTQVSVTVDKLPSNINVETQPIEMYVGDNATIVASTDNDAGLFFTTDSGIISLAGDGRVTGLAEGSAEIVIFTFETQTHLANRTTLGVTVNKIPTEIIVESTEIAIDVDGSKQINATLNHPDAGSITYTSSNPDVITVDADGRITALKGGEANITISYGGNGKYVAADDVIVKVIANRIQTGIQTNQTISVDVYGENAIVVLNGEGRQIHYISTNSSIVTVGDDGVIRGIIGGLANVTVIFDENEKYLGEEVNVTVTVNKLPSIFTNGTMTLSVDENATINSSLNHGGAVRYEFDSSKLNVTEDGLVTALAGGVHTIRVIFDGDERYLENSSEVTVTVNRLQAEYDGSPINLTVFDTENIEYIVAGYDHTNSTYSSGNETVFTVDENGLITALGGGSAVLNIQIPESDRYLQDSINITVNVEKLPTTFEGQTQITVKVNESKGLEITANHNRQLIYESSNLNIVTVDANGLIRGIIGGTAFITVRFEEDGQYLANSIRVNVTVEKLPSVITVENQSVEMYIDDEAVIIATTDSDGVLIFTTDSTFITITEDGRVTGIGEGTATVKISVPETETHLANDTNIEVTVKRIPTEISVESAQITIDVDGTVLVNATLNYPQAGSLNYTTSNPEIVTVDADGRITALIGGNANITVSYEGNEKYGAAQDVIVEVFVNKLPTVIEANATFSLKVDDSISIGATANNNDSQLKYASSNSSVVIVDELTGEMIAVGAGVANITISCGPTDRYLAADDVIVTVEVSRIETSISLDSENPVEMNVFEDSEIIAGLNHSQAGDLTYTSSDENVATVDSDGVITAVGGGKANITVSYAGNDKYAPAQNVTVTVIVSRLKSEIIVDDAISLDVDGFKSLNAYMENGRPLTYMSNDESIAVVDEHGVVYAMTGGKTNITIAFEGDSEYEGCEVNVSVTVNKLKSTINVEDMSLAVDVGGNVEIIATTDSDAELAYASCNSSIAAVNGIVITGIIGGTVNVTVSASESGRYLASEKNVTVTVRKLQPSLSIEDSSLVIDVDGSVLINASTNSDAELSYVSLNPSVASVDGNVVTGLIGGTATVTVGVAESGRYLAKEVNVTVTVNKLHSVIDIENAHLAVDVYGNVLINASTNSDADLIYVSLNPTVASVEDNVATGIIGGTAIVTVRVVESDRYLEKEVNVTVTVNKIQSIIDLEENSLVVDVDGSVMINASTNSDADLAYASLNSTIAAVNGNVVMGIVAGTVNVSVSVDESDRYLGKTVNVTVTVNKAQSAIDVSDITIYVDEERPINASLNVNGNLRFINNNPKIVSIDEAGLIKGLIGGTARITVIFDETDKYLGSEANVTVTVNKLHSAIILESDSLTVEVEGSVLINASTNSDGILFYEILDESIVTLDSNNVSALIGGSAIVTVSVGETERFLAKSVNVTVTVKRHDSIITVEDDEIVITVGGKEQIAASTNSDSPIIFSIGSPFISIDGTGMITGVSNGTAEVLLNVAESDRYSANSTVVIVRVNKNPTAITVNENISVTVGDEGNLNATLGHEGQLNYTSLDESIVSIDSNGNIRALKVGNTQIVVSFEENGQYLGDSITVNVTVNKIDVPQDNAISMDLKDASKSPTFSIDLPNATGNFSVIVDGKQFGPVSLKDGKASIKVPELAYGKHNVTVVYSGDDNYNPISQNATVNIIKPVLSNNKDISMLYTGKASYQVRVTVAGKPVSGQNVAFKFNGRTYNVKTDKNGYAVLKLPSVKPKKAAYIITATFKDITVKNKVKVTSIIKAKNLKYKKSKKVLRIKVTLKKVNGKYLKGKRLKLKIKGKTLKAKTNKKGKAVFKVKRNVLKKLKVGKTYRYKVSYGKDIVTKKIKVKR